jgi:hypothetical protein
VGEVANTTAEILAAHEAVIQEAGERFFVVAGTELDAIRTDKSYKATHPTFEAYCRERWGFTASRARQMIRAAKAVTTGNASGKTEREIRQAISSPPEPDRAKAEAELEEAIRQLRTGGGEHSPDGSVSDVWIDRLAQRLASILERAGGTVVEKTHRRLRDDARRAEWNAKRLEAACAVFDRVFEEREKAERQRRREEWERRKASD